MVPRFHTFGRRPQPTAAIWDLSRGYGHAFRLLGWAPVTSAENFVARQAANHQRSLSLPPVRTAATRGGARDLPFGGATIMSPLLSITTGSRHDLQVENDRSAYSAWAEQAFAQETQARLQKSGQRESAPRARFLAKC